MSKATITINGRLYDAVTGQPIATAAVQHRATPVAAAKTAPARAFSDIAPHAQRAPQPSTAQPASVAHQQAAHQVHAAAQTVHQVTQKSQTLYRRALKKPAVHSHEPAHHRSPLIHHFTTPQVVPVPIEDRPQPVIPEPQDPPATMHPAVARALQQHAQQAESQPALTGSELKDQLIKERLAEVGNAPAKKDKKTRWLGRQPRLVTILSSTLALLILGGYLTYITLPSISLKVAASRAGVNAAMPEYKPDGYSLDGPITYSPGEVVISYKSNTNDSGYKLIQKATNWDSQAVLDNYVTKLTDNYLTFQERGVTVYTFGNRAAWVNGGLLYTVDGNASLSSDQILRLATSL